MDEKSKVLQQQLDEAESKLISLQQELRQTKETLRTLKENTERYLDLAHIIFVALDDQANITMIGGNSLKILGYTAEELVGRNWFEMCLSPSDIDHVNIVYKQLMAGQQDISEYYENDIVTKSGESRHIAWHNSVIRDEADKIIGTLSSGIDITERKQAESALRESERKYRLLFENMTSGFALHEIITDDNNKPVDYRYLEINPAFEKLTGVPVSALLGKTLLDLMPDTEKYWIETFGNVALTGESIAYENYSRELGKYYDTWVYSPQKNQFAVIFSDCTTRKLAEQSLQETKVMLEKAQEVAHVGSWAWDFSNKRYSWSDEMLRIFDIDKDALDNSINIAEQVAHPSDRAKVLALHKQLLEMGKSVSLEYRVVRKNKDITWVHASSEVLYQDGKPLRIVGSVQDITGQKVQDEQLRRSQKMDALGKLTGGVAHDYNNILNIVIGYSQILQDALKENPTLKKYADEITRVCVRGSNLTRKLLTFSRSKKTKTAAVNLNELLQDEKDLLQKTMTPRIKLEMDLIEDIWPVNMDSADFEDAILNLCINANYAMQDGGKLMIRTLNQHLDINELQKIKLPEGDYVVLKISDTGSGISEDIQQKIFDPFFTTKGDEGIGLGLSIVFGFVRSCGGDIGVMSKPGEGSEFTLYFPRGKDIVVEHDDEYRKKFADTRGHESILVVDDEVEITNFTKIILAKQGYEVFIANDGESALKILASTHIDVLVSDILMPGMDGYELAKKVRQQYPALKVKLMTGYDENRKIDPVIDDLVKNILYKPFEASDFLGSIRQLLDDKDSKANQTKPLLLVMDDDDNILKLFELNLGKLGYDTVLARNGSEALALYQDYLHSERPVDALIIDYRIKGGMNGDVVAQEILKIDPAAKMIVSSGDTFSPAMVNYQEYGFKGAIEKNFNRTVMKSVIEDVLFSAT